MDNKRYFTDQDHQTLIYFQLPKVLMLAEKYKSMSNDAKLLYVYFLDLNKLSTSRGWKDDAGRYYIKFRDEKGMQFIGCKKEKYAKLKKELQKYDLIDIQRRGQGKTNLMYVLKLEYTESDIYEVNEAFENVAEDSDEVDRKAEVRKSNISTESNEVRKSNDKKFENRTSRSSEIEQQEVRKSNAINKNSFSNTSFIENDLINSSSSSSEEYGQGDISETQVKEEEEVNEIADKLIELGFTISDSKIMRTKRHVDQIISLVVERELTDFDEKDIQNAIELYIGECAKRRIGQPPLFFVNGFEMVLNKKYSYEVGSELRRLNNSQKDRLAKIVRKELPLYNWLED